jgi:hypothetical protein
MVRRSLIAVGSVVGAALTAFHVWLFAGQIWSGALADPAMIARWAVAAGLVGGLFYVRRQGDSLVRSRRAIALWVLAALLHGPAIARQLDGPPTPAVPEIVVTLSQVAAGLVLLAGLVLATRRQTRPTWAFDSIFASPHIAPSSALFNLTSLPRPPPIRE